MALAAGNAHLGHYYSLDIPILMRTIDDDALDKCRGNLCFIQIFVKLQIDSPPL